MSIHQRRRAASGACRRYAPAHATPKEAGVSYGKLLMVIGRINPRAWDALIPHGPAIRQASRFERVALNPQPLPPREAFLVAAAQLANEVVRAAVALGGREGNAGLVSELVDDWCGTPWPRRWPWPWPGPRPDDDGRGPQPDPWDIATARAIGAIVFASTASRLGPGELRDVFERSAEQLAEAAVGG
jgi:hypothetical protein